MLSSGSGNALRQAVQHFGRIVEGRQDFQEACAGIHTVVEAVPAFFKENVAAHFAGNQCAGFFMVDLMKLWPVSFTVASRLILSARAGEWI